MANFGRTPEEQLKSGVGLYQSLDIERPAPHPPLVDYHANVRSIASSPLRCGIAHDAVPSCPFPRQAIWHVDSNKFQL
jgi:hypothetical protein